MKIQEKKLDVQVLGFQKWYLPVIVKNLVHIQSNPPLKSKQPQRHSRTPPILSPRSYWWTSFHYIQRTSIQWIYHCYLLWSMAIKFMDFLLFIFKDNQILPSSFTRILWSCNTRRNIDWLHSNAPALCSIHQRSLAIPWSAYYPIYSMGYSWCAHLLSWWALVLLLQEITSVYVYWVPHPIPRICIQDHQRSILQEYSRLYDHHSIPWDLNTPTCHSKHQATALKPLQPIGKNM